MNDPTTVGQISRCGDEPTTVGQAARCGDEPTTVGQAARCGDVETMKQLIHEGHPVDVQDNRGWRPTHEAADGGYVECLQILLQQDATDLNWQSFDGATALMVSAGRGHTEFVRELLAHGADPNLANAMLETPLLAAVQTSSVDCVRALVDHGADLSMQQYCGTSALHQAAAQGLVEVTQLLLSHGAAPGARDQNGITPVFAAAHFGHLACLTALVEHTVSTDQQCLLDVSAEDGATPLYLAAQEGHTDCVRLLLHHGANANLLTTVSPVALPLHAAVMMGHIECIQLLYPHTHQSLLDRCEVSPLHLAMQHSEGHSLQCLLDLGMDPNYHHRLHTEHAFVPQTLRFCSDSLGLLQEVSPLVALFFYSEHPLLHADILLQGGCSVKPKSARHLSPLLAALDAHSPGCMHLVRLFVSHGAEVNVTCPLVQGNLVLLTCLPSWKTLLFVLRCGACPDSCFQHHHSVGSVRSTDSQSNSSVQETSPTSVHQTQSLQDPSGTVQDPSGTVQVIPFHRTLSQAIHSSQWRHLCVGRVLQVMLRFSTATQLDASLRPLLGSAQEWQQLVELTGKPRSLLHLSRCSVRRSLSAKQLFEESNTRQLLPLPDLILDYLFYKELWTPDSRLSVL